jgi:O-antigen/teichoic acid export membrane protein
MAKLQRLVTVSARIILFLNLAITIGFVLLGKLFLRQIFGAPYEAAYIPLLILLGGQLVNSGVGSVAMLLNMTRHEHETAKGMTLAAALNVVLNLLLLPRAGIVGSAIATAVSLIIWNMLLWWAVQKKLHINSLAFYFDIGSPS